MNCVMRPSNLAALGLFGLIGCVESSSEITQSTLRIEPADLSVTIVDGKAQTHAFTATLVEADGSERDVTSETTFLLADDRYGSVSRSQVEVGGDALGPTRLLAAHRELGAAANLTVYARTNRFEDVPAAAPTYFEGAVIDASCEPAISYPAANVVVPQNLGALDIHWLDGNDDLFKVALATEYFEVRIYTRRDHYNAGITQLAGADWSRLAAQREAIELSVTGVRETAPQVACKTTQQLYVTDQALTGGLFYMNDRGMYRFDAAHPTVAAAELITTELWNAMILPVVGATPNGCFGCALSRDGSRLAVASETTGVIYDFATKTLTAPSDDQAPRTWSFATFNQTGTKLITADGGNLRVIDAKGKALGKVDHEPNVAALDPQLSPDGRWLANVESMSSMMAGTSLVVRTFDDDTSSFGAPRILVGADAGTANVYPTWSADGQWIAFTRITGWGTFDTFASLWVVKSDGTRAPVQVTEPTQTLDIHARWVPAMLTVDGERMTYLTYESKQAYGEVLASGRMQIWAAPFYPDRAPTATPCATMTISNACERTYSAIEPAFRMMQPHDVDNRLVQWAN